jgi:hypothetical protein
MNYINHGVWRESTLIVAAEKIKHEKYNKFMMVSHPFGPDTLVVTATSARPKFILIKLVAPPLRVMKDNWRC